MYIFLIIIVVFAVSFVIFSDIKKKKAKITTQNKNRIGSHKKTSSKNNILNYMRACEENPENPSLIGKLACLIIMFPLSDSLNDTVLKNKYVKMDAALILLIYAIKKAGRELLVLNNKLFVRYIFEGILMFYNVSLDELTKFQSNRLGYFEKYLDKVYPNIESYVDEATLLLRYDYCYNKYVEFTESVPIIVDKNPEQDLKTQMQIKTYFFSVIDMIDKYLEEYEI